MHVLDERPEARVAVSPADGEQRELAVERDDLLRELALRERLDAVDPALPLAVVAEPAGLDERGQSCLLEGAVARRRECRVG